MSNSASTVLPMVATTPFHERLAPLNETGLWQHWSGHLPAVKYQMSEKFEYFAVRNSAGLIDTSPLYKYRITGRDAERFLGGVLARDIGACRDGQAQYTLWCDEQRVRGRGRRGVPLLAADDFLLTAAEPNLAYFRTLIGYDCRSRSTTCRPTTASLAVQGPRSRAILSAVAPELEALGFFHHAQASSATCPITSRAPATPATWATSCGSSRTTPTRCGTRCSRRAPVTA